jgi:hypothetical protein
MWYQCAMKALAKIGLLSLLAFLGFVGGGMIGAQFVPEGSGLAGGATVFLWALGGVISAIVGGSLAVSRLSARAQRLMLLGSLVLTILIFVLMAARI